MLSKTSGGEWFLVYSSTPTDIYIHYLLVMAKTLYCYFTKWSGDKSQWTMIADEQQAITDRQLLQKCFPHYTAHMKSLWCHFKHDSLVMWGGCICIDVLFLPLKDKNKLIKGTMAQKK